MLWRVRVTPSPSGRGMTRVSGSGKTTNQKSAAPHFLSQMLSIHSSWGWRNHTSPLVETLIAFYLHRLPSFVQTVQINTNEVLMKLKLRKTNQKKTLQLKASSGSMAQLLTRIKKNFYIYQQTQSFQNTFRINIYQMNLIQSTVWI